ASRMSVSSSASDVQAMFGSIAGRYDLANTVLSLGLHDLWRKTAAKMLPPNKSGRVLDLCTGTADCLPLLSKRFREVVGVDFSFPMLQVGERKQRPLSNVSLLQGDGLQLPFRDSSFDGVTVAFGVRNFENLDRG